MEGEVRTVRSEKLHSAMQQAANLSIVVMSNEVRHLP